MIIDDKEQSVDDPVQEIRKIRDEHAKKFNYDLAAMFEGIKKFARDQNLKTVSPATKAVDKKTGS